MRAILAIPEAHLHAVLAAGFLVLEILQEFRQRFEL
jgi:hypothetical protein